MRDAAAPDTHVPTPVTLTQVSSNTLATTSLGCVTGTDTSQQAYYRVFDLAAMGVTGSLALSSVAFGVQSASGTQALAVRVGVYNAVPGAALNTGPTDWGGGDITPLAAAASTVNASANGMIITVPIAVTVPQGARLIVEIASPDDSAKSYSSFFLAASSGSETASGYFWAPGCGIAAPGTPASLGQGIVPFLITATGSY